MSDDRSDIRTHRLAFPVKMLLTILFAGLMWALADAGDSPADERAGIEFFEAKIRPVLADICFLCHSADAPVVRGDFRLDSREALLKGGSSGPAVIPGEPEKSLLIKAVRYTDPNLQMPPVKRLSSQQVADFETWVKMGAPYPHQPGASPAAEKSDDRMSRARAFWSFQPPKDHPAPPVKLKKWPQTPIDHFVLAQLEAKGLRPALPADKRTLIRRATFDLIGLPPRSGDVDAFLSDTSPEAFAKVVDRLLASPQYGERWGRFWLDLARYADTKGYVFEEERRYPYAYTYRDWVIRAFNKDMPYDQFLIRQIAADRLPPGDDPRSLAALGFLTVGRRFLNNMSDIIDDRIDVVTRTTMALTVSCARCHNHKFDAIPTKDYYSLYGVFASSTEPKDLPLLGAPAETEDYRAFQKELAARKAEVTRFLEGRQSALHDALRQVFHLSDAKIHVPLDAVESLMNRADKNKLRDVRKKVDQLQVTHPGAPACAMVMTDAPKPNNPRVFLRGNPNQPGEEVPRQFLAVLSGENRRPFQQGSGRLDLAQAIANENNPLTARVLVNRVWLHHFGTGLVRTPSDFGLRSEPPTHPELLDYLARRFMRDGWSLKKLHRLIMLSSVYQQSSEGSTKGRQVDPENQLLWRMNRQRLDFEALRDALLAVSGQMDATMGGRSVDLTTQPFSRRRTVYGFIDRQNLPSMFRAFDMASPDTHSPQRYSTTVPQQALFMMNSPFVIEQARHLARRPDVTAEPTTAGRIQQIYRLVYQRAATPAEVALGERFLKAAESSDNDGLGGEGGKNHPSRLTAWEAYAQALLQANEFVFVD